MNRSQLILLGAAGVTASATVALLQLPGPEVEGSRSPVSAAVRAVADGRGPVDLAMLPADFSDVMGYVPRMRDGRLTDRHGDCSSAVPLPAEFLTACAEHDLGYDLLRYAERTRQPLGGWARAAIDDRMGASMQAACAERSSELGRLRCTAAADVATVAVRLNSLRQRNGSPSETAASAALTTTVALAALTALRALPSVLRPAWRGVRRRRSA
jgi:hypothetical protein